MAEYIKIEDMHFTQLRRHINRICTHLRDNYYKNKNNENIDKSLTIVLDDTFLTISGKGTYIEDKWKKERREYLKLHIAVDIKSKQIISFRVTKGMVHDTRKSVL